MTTAARVEPALAAGAVLISDRCTLAATRSPAPARVDHPLTGGARRSGRRCLLRVAPRSPPSAGSPPSAQELFEDLAMQPCRHRYDELMAACPDASSGSRSDGEQPLDCGCRRGDRGRCRRALGENLRRSARRARSGVRRIYLGLVIAAAAACVPKVTRSFAVRGGRPARRCAGRAGDRPTKVRGAAWSGAREASRAGARSPCSTPARRALRPRCRRRARWLRFLSLAGVPFDPTGALRRRDRARRVRMRGHAARSPVPKLRSGGTSCGPDEIVATWSATRPFSSLDDHAAPPPPRQITPVDQPPNGRALAPTSGGRPAS